MAMELTDAKKQLGPIGASVGDPTEVGSEDMDDNCQ